MSITLEEYTDLLKKYEELRQDKIRILNKYYVEKDDLKQEIERLNNIIKEAKEYTEEKINIAEKKFVSILNKFVDIGVLEYILEILDKENI